MRMGRRKAAKASGLTTGKVCDFDREENEYKYLCFPYSLLDRNRNRKRSRQSACHSTEEISP